jgi:flagellin
MVINTNVQALQTANNLNTSSNALAKSLSRLSSGSKIIAPSDDAAGLAVSSRLESQLKRLDAAINNVVNAVSFTQTQDGFLKTIDKAFRRMSELAMFAQDSTKSASDLTLYSQEFVQLQDYVSQSVKQTFNSVKLFSATPLAVTIDSSGTTFDMAPIDLGQSEYVSSLSQAAAFSATTTQFTGSLANKTLTMAVSEEEYKKIAVGGSFTVGNLTTGASKTALNTAKANLVTKTAEKATADTAVAGNTLAKAYFDAVDTQAAKLALKTAAIATVNTKVASNTDATAYFAATTSSAKATLLSAASGETKSLILAKNYFDAASGDKAAALTAAAADSGTTTYTNAAAYTATATDYDTATTAVATANTAVNPTSATSASTAAKTIVDAKTAADTAVTDATTAVTTAQTAYDTASRTDISGLNGTYDISQLTSANGGYQVVLDISNNTKALAIIGNITDFGVDANPNSSTAVNLKSGLDITSVPRAQASLTRIRNSIDKLAQDRASLGAVQSRLNFTNEQLTVTKENLSAAISRIADVDVAEEATSYARYQILVQSGTSMLAQANKMPQSALQLLQG